MRILIGFDGSDGAKDALELARVLMPFEDGESTLIYVAGPSWPTTLGYEEMVSGSLPEARELLADGADAIGGGAKSKVYVGASPARVLTEVAEREEADLIVVGSPHRGPVGRALVGSVAERLLHGASCAVAVAPRGFAASRLRPARARAPRIGVERPSAQGAVPRPGGSAGAEVASIRRRTTDGAVGVPWEPRRNPVDGSSKEPGENRMHLRLHKPEKPPAPPTPTLSRGVCVEAAGAELRGALDVPTGARGLVLFASDRHLGRIDPRQANLARELNRRGLGTLLVDLVEGSDSASVGSDVDVLTERLLGATAWSGEQWGVEDLPVGYVGSGLGAAAALSAAAKLGRKIGAVASHSGRPDLATADLGEVRAPTLLVVDASDSSMVAANAMAATQLLRCPHRLQKVRTRGSQGGIWAATPAVCRWMEWHLGSPEVPYEPRLILG